MNLIKSKFSFLYRHKFIRNILLVISGTASAQAIGLAVMPLITRLYAPTEFGVLGTFTALCSAIIPVVALTYPIAIVIAETELEAKKIAILSTFIGLLLSCFSTILLLIFGEQIMLLFNLEGIRSFIYLVPIVMALATLNQVGRQWSIKNGSYKVLITSTISQALFVNLSRLAVGLTFPMSVVLIATYVFGNIIASTLLAFNLIKTIWRSFFSITIFELKKVAIKYIDFPKYRAPQVALNAFSESMPVLFLSVYFDSESVGFYALARLTLGVPIGLIGQSVSDVFFPKFAGNSGTKCQKKKLLVRVSVVVAVLAAPVFTLLSFYAPVIYRVVFGNDWEGAGQFAGYMSIWLFFVLVSKPAISVIPALKLQRFFLLFEFFSLQIKFLAIYIGYISFNESLMSVAYLSFVSSACYLYLLGYIYIKS